MSRCRISIALCVGMALACGGQFWLWGQQPDKAQGAAASNRCELEVMQSYDAKYQGDMPGHMGRAGGLENRKLQVALGDPVFRGEQQVGKVTFLGWSRPHGSLEVEFAPQAGVRVCVGDVVWLALDGKPQPAVSR